MKRFLLVTIICMTAIFSTAFAEETTINGKVEIINKEAGYIVVNGTTISADADLIDEIYLEIGDKVNITAEETDGELRLAQCEYIFNEESYEDSEDTSSYDY